MERVDVEEKVSVVVDEREIPVPDSKCDSSSPPNPDQFVCFVRSGMVRLEEGIREHEIVNNSFLSGMERLKSGIKVVATHKNTYRGLSGKARLEGFRIFSEAVTRKCGGNANMKYAWYGASKDEIIQILSHGFSRCGGPETGELYGSGVYLSPAKFSIDAALSSLPDENGLSHVLLCRVILGNMEVVCPGSQQFRPSSREFDTGVDFLPAPRRYVVWSPYMNSHIFPNYIVSFKASVFNSFQSVPAPEVKPTGSPSPWMRFPILMYMLSRILPLPTMDLIAKYYSFYRENKIMRLKFVQRLRELAGDELLMAAIKSCKIMQRQAEAAGASGSHQMNETTMHEKPAEEGSESL
ncbi:probable inactive poly [ADP-ribose] polymerase SRO2 [Malania oleifera]|uniref:probable inactive poly [ADP-ribose] polymerase SRO2 n=1 Tax=Malania oleifera TaxID=397392 RepID=UPI0025AEBA62|nr:probable inactive poly [ADP-ribose] polymerase SRO2 [Malania oleifera]XP_057948825.1 probable inactive poly [ADP-ribose] polymerase SRO2 [Malania oleifera]